jgi:hypothetical protein
MHAILGEVKKDDTVDEADCEFKTRHLLLHSYRIIVEESGIPFLNNRFPWPSGTESGSAQAQAQAQSHLLAQFRSKNIFRNLEPKDTLDDGAGVMPSLFNNRVSYDITDVAYLWFAAGTFIYVILLVMM